MSRRKNRETLFCNSDAAYTVGLGVEAEAAKVAEGDPPKSLPDVRFGTAHAALLALPLEGPEVPAGLANSSPGIAGEEKAGLAAGLGSV